MSDTFLDGNLTRDPELKSVIIKATGKETSVCRFSIAVNRGWGDKKTVGYYNCEVWGFWAVSIAKAKKGQPVVVFGSFENKPYEKDGVKKDFWYLKCDKAFRVIRDEKPSDPDPAMNDPWAEGE